MQSKAVGKGYCRESTEGVQRANGEIDRVSQPFSGLTQKLNRLPQANRFYSVGSLWLNRFLDKTLHRTSTVRGFFAA
jgi:hypothetical protein